jgi:hypothetical protein
MYLPQRVRGSKERLEWGREFFSEDTDIGMMLLDRM